MSDRKLGDTVYVARTIGWRGEKTISQHTVQKITPTGQIVLSGGLRLNARGLVAGEHAYNLSVVSSDRAAEIRQQMRERAWWSVQESLCEEAKAAARERDIDRYAAAARALASAIEARRAETGTGSVHESAVPQADAQ